MRINNAKYLIDCLLNNCNKVQFLVETQININAIKLLRDDWYTLIDKHRTISRRPKSIIEYINKFIDYFKKLEHTILIDLGYFYNPSMTIISKTNRFNKGGQKVQKLLFEISIFIDKLNDKYNILNVFFYNTFTTEIARINTEKDIKRTLKEYGLEQYQDNYKLNLYKIAYKILDLEKINSLMKNIFDQMEKDIKSGLVNDQFHETKFSVGDMKIEWEPFNKYNINPLYTDKNLLKTSEMDSPDLKRYIDSIKRAKILLEKNGFGFLWKGLLLLRGRDNAIINTNTGGSFSDNNNTIYLYINTLKDASINDKDFYERITFTLIHELGHRLQKLHMNTDDRNNFIKYFKNYPVISSYGLMNDREYFAELFAHYIMGGKYKSKIKSSHMDIMNNIINTLKNK